MPRLIPTHEWNSLTLALAQRARAIEMFLRDVYGPAEIVRDGVLDWDEVTSIPTWDDAARALPAGVVRAPVIGFDLVQDHLGGWRVLEDNTRVPSGVGYAIGMRSLMIEQMPELFGQVALRDPASTLDLIGSTLRSCALGLETGREPVVALLSDGGGNSAWYEHRCIADGAGLALVQPDDIEISGGKVLAAAQPTDVLYLRIEPSLGELCTTRGGRIGAEILRVANDGNVTLANTPGAGVADDKACFCLVPELITYYLDERPLLAPVPTYRCGHDDELGIVLARLDELVTKPVDGYGGQGELIGSAASTVELDQRRRDIETNPSAWIAQEVVAMSTHPTLANGRLEPRHVDLRAFAYVRGTGEGDVELGDLALTRVAPAGSMVVNSSRGGGAKDTWIAARAGTGDDDREG